MLVLTEVNIFTLYDEFMRGSVTTQLDAPWHKEKKDHTGVPERELFVLRTLDVQEV